MVLRESAHAFYLANQPRIPWARQKQAGSMMSPRGQDKA